MCSAGIPFATSDASYCFSSERPHSSKAANTYSSVKPKEVAYLSEVVVTTSRLFRSENIDSLLTRVIPVMMARSSHGLVLNAELNMLLVNATSSSHYSMLIFNVLPKRRGRVMRVTSSPLSHHSLIKAVLST